MSGDTVNNVCFMSTESSLDKGSCEKFRDSFGECKSEANFRAERAAKFILLAASNLDGCGERWP